MRPFSILYAIAVVWTVLIMGIGWGVSECTAAPTNIAGIWLGTITVPGVELRIAFEIAEAKEGAYTAKMHSIDQSAMNIPVSAVTLTGDSLKLDVTSIPGSYEGKLTADGDTIEGKWMQGGAIPLAMKRVDKLPEFNRPQTPKKPFPYRDEEVTYENRTAGVKLAGTLTIPAGKVDRSRR